jgi:hypothetical protein
MHLVEKRFGIFHTQCFNQQEHSRGALRRPRALFGPRQPLKSDQCTKNRLPAAVVIQPVSAHSPQVQRTKSLETKSNIECGEKRDFRPILAFLGKLGQTLAEGIEPRYGAISKSDALAIRKELQKSLA